MATFNVILCDQSTLGECYWALQPDQGASDSGGYSRALNYCCNGITCPHFRNYTSKELLQMRFKPMDVGCTSWDACEFHDPPTMLPTAGGTLPTWACNPNVGDDCALITGSCPPIYPNTQWGVVTKTGYDTTFAKSCCNGTQTQYQCDPSWIPGSQVCAAILNPPAPCANLAERSASAPAANRPACCLGQMADPSQCAPAWCPLDPMGSCSDILSAQCQTQTSCGRHALLTDPTCNSWYTAASQAGHPAQSLVEGLVADFCASPAGQVAGECACRNAYEIVSALSNPPVLGQSGENPQMATLRRVDLYCVPGAATTAAIAADPTGPIAQACAATASSTPLNPVPTGGLPTWLPPHCWLPDCQPNSSFCRFADPREDLLQCPNTCVQISGGNQVSVGSLSATTAIMIDDLFTSCNFADSQQPLGYNNPLFAIPEAGAAGELEVCVAPGTAVEIPLTLLNNANDPHWASLSSVNFQVSTSLSPLLSVQPASGLLGSGGQVNLTLKVDTSSFPTDDLTAYNGSIGVFDSSGANNPTQILVAVRTVPPAQAGPSGQCLTSSATVRVSQPPPDEPSSSEWILWALLALGSIALLYMLTRRG